MFGIMSLVFDSSSEESLDSYTTEDGYTTEDNVSDEEKPDFYIGNQLTLNEKCTISGHTLELLLQDIASRLVEVNLQPTKQQLLTTLHWMGIGGSMEGIANIRGISNANILSSVQTVVHAINTVKSHETVTWPADCTTIVDQFHALAGIPNVVGAIEGVLVKIDVPEDNKWDAYNYVDRNENESINCMVVCGPDYKFYYANAGWPGSEEDQRVFRTSSLFLSVEEGWQLFPNNGVLLGDSAYPQLSWLIRPKRTNLDEEKVQLFNNAHEKTRKPVVERSLGILKRKFPCLNHLRVDPALGSALFLCCLTLHNLTLTDDDLDDDDVRDNIEDNDIIDELDESYFEGYVGGNNGEAKQQELINLFDGESNANNNVNQRKFYNERIDFMIDNEFTLNENYRISAHTIELLLKDIGHRLGHTTRRNNPLSEKHQLLTSLYWLGKGDTMNEVSSMTSTSSSSVSRCLHSVVEAINDIKFNEIVSWPTDCTSVVAQFQAMGGIPLVVGALEGVLVNIDTPRANKEHYLDRKGKHSINCMVVCGPDHRFYYVSAESPGSEDDANVLRQSTLFQRMEEGWRPFPNGILLGDSAYPLRSWLIRPKSTDFYEVEKVQHFNMALEQTRKPVVERSLGILKQKFMCLNQLRVEPVFAGNIFKCCVTLHNLTCNSDDDDDVDDDIRDKIEDDVIIVDAYDMDNLEEAGGVDRQEEMINYFAY